MLGFCLLVLLLGGAWVHPASAQPGRQDTTATLVGTFKPLYTTVYDINRAVTTWTQDFAFGTQNSLLNFNNKTNFNVRTDSGRDETRRDGSNTLTMRWLLIPRLPISTDLLLGRIAVARPNDEREADNANLNLNAQHAFAWGTLRHTLQGGGGFNRRSDLSVRNESSSRSTDSGWSGNGSWRGNWRATKALTASGQYRYQRSDKTSELQRDNGPTEDRPTKNQSQTLNMSMQFTPIQWFNANASFNDVSGNDEYFIVQGGLGALEKKINSQRTLTGNFSIKPSSVTELQFRASNADHTLGYRVRTDIASIGDNRSWGTTLKTRLLGTQLEGRLSRNLDNLKPATSADTKNKTSIFEGKLTRPLKRDRLSFQFDWLLRTTQLFFFDQSPGFQPLDRDERRTKIQPTLRYTPGDRWIVNASYIGSTSLRVEQNPDRAAQTRSDEDYTVDISINFELSGRTSISQIYSIKALYTQFDFNPQSDRLLRTQRVITNIGSYISRRVFLFMEHRFSRQDSGPFSNTEETGRVFARDQRTYNQELTTDLKYTVLPWLTLSLYSRFQRTDDIAEASQLTRTTKNLELREGVELKQDVGAGMDFSARAYYTRSNIRDSYWLVVSSLNKQF